jgi:AraC-like DNA-binding protein
MSILFDEKERSSESPYVEAVMYGRTASDGQVIRPAEVHWHMAVVRHQGKVMPIVVGPLTTSGIATFIEGAEILWIKFKLGTYMPHLPARQIMDVETTLPEATSQTFWLKGSAWEFPDYENVDTFIARLVREDILAFDPVVSAVLDDCPHDLSPRTVRHRFLNSAGVTQNHIYQVQRAYQAATLLRRGSSILDTIHELGYFDQPHLTRALKQWVGFTPGQLVAPVCATSPIYQAE